MASMPARESGQEAVCDLRPQITPGENTFRSTYIDFYETDLSCPMQDKSPPRGVLDEEQERAKHFCLVHAKLPVAALLVSGDAKSLTPRPPACCPFGLGRRLNRLVSFHAIRLFRGSFGPAPSAWTGTHDAKSWGTCCGSFARKAGPNATCRCFALASCYAGNERPRVRAMSPVVGAALRTAPHEPHFQSTV